MKDLLRKCGVAYGFALLLCVCGLLLFVHFTRVEMPLGGLLVGMLAWAVILLVLEQREWIFFPLLLIVLGFLIFFRAGGFRTYDVPPALTWLVFLVLMMLLWGFAWLLRWFGVRLVVSLLVVAGWLMAAFGVVSVPRAAVVLAVPLPLFTLMEILHFKSPERSRNAVPLLCVSVLFSLILAVVPISEQPYPYKWVKRAWNGIETLWEKIETQLFYRDEKGTAFSMDFNGEAKASSTTKAKEKDAQSLKVWLDFGDACVMYLPGTTLDYFDGQSWSDHLEDAEADGVFDWQYDTAEHIYALWRRDQAAGTISEDVFRARQTDLTYRKMDTKTLFTTPGVLRIRVDDDRYPYHAHAGNVQFDYQQKKDCFYILYFLEENPEQVEALIRVSEGYAYDGTKSQSWGQISGDYSEQFLLRMVQTVQIEQAMAARYEIIQSHYLELPDDLPVEVVALAREITSGCETEYDTVRAIEAYLHENYTYKRNPSMPGKGETLLEHMIDAQEGYCTWFATAACVMLRSQGIPTRFVQGYRTALRGQTRVYLDEDDQHAWCEAYISGYGWITVEASPGFTSSKTAWEMQIAQEEAAAAEEEGMSEEDTMAEESAEETSGVGVLLWVALGLVALGVLAAFLVRRLLQQRKYERMSFNDRCELDLRAVLKLLEKRHFVRYPYETLRVFFAKVLWDDLEVPAETARDALQAFEDSVFGPEDVDESGWQAGQALVKALKEKKKKKKSVIK